MDFPLAPRVWIMGNVEKNAQSKDVVTYDFLEKNESVKNWSFY